MNDASSRTVVAAFDFDHTLTTSDSVVPFLLVAVGKRGLVGTVLRSPFQVAMGLVRRDRDGLRAIVTRSFAGRSVDDVRGLATTYAAGALRSKLRADTVERLRAHLAAGHRVVIVSASYEDYLTIVAGDLGVDAVLSSRLAAVDGVCTGELDGANCRAAEKVRRIEQWLAVEGLSRAGVEVHAYGDSEGDRDLLEWADHATWVSSDPLPPELAD